MRAFNFFASLECFRYVLSVSQVILIFLVINAEIFQISADHHKDELRLVPRYKYSYHVRNVEGGQHGHHVHRNGPHTEGKYYVKLNEGATQNVEYYTDQFGYHPKVVYSNNGNSATSGAKIVFGGEINDYQSAQNSDLQKNDTETDTFQTSSSPSVKFAQFPPNSEVIMKTSLEFGIPLIDPNSAGNSTPVLQDTSSTLVVEPNETSLLLPAPSAPDSYIQPELNEITNEFLGKIISVVPEIFTSTRLIRPIIVSENSTISRKADDQSGAGAAHLVDYSTPSVEELKSDKNNETADSKKLESGVEVLIEPQNVEEQAVITTTLDISKSLPLAVNFVPDVDNHIQEAVNHGLPVPPVQFINQANPLIIPPQSTPAIYPAVIPRATFAQQYPYPGFHYIPIPVVQHQPNIIPLNFVNDVKNSPQPSHNISEHQVKDTRIPINQHHNEVPDRKQVKYRSIGNQPSTPYQPQILRRPQTPFAANVPASHLIPHVKHVTNTPHNYQQYLKHRSNSEIPPTPHSVAYNIKYFPREAGAKSQPHKSAPFKPSHPLWDSIYPPSHMYYVPYLVFDKIPPGADRKARDSTSKRNHRYLRRLYVEYGGFKPPMIPSTLLESEDITEKQEVPSEKSKSA